MANEIEIYHDVGDLAFSDQPTSDLIDTEIHPLDAGMERENHEGTNP
jgi:hypothetical protein